MRALLLTPDRNTGGRRDWSGAFKPEAEGFCRTHAIPLSAIRTINVGVPWAARRRETLSRICSIDPPGPLECVAFFCHGWMRGFQLGFDRTTVQPLADAIAMRSTKSVVVPLYCCSTGDDPQDDPLSAVGTGDDSFADRLRDALCKAGAVHCKVTAHTTAAHVTRNPYVVVFEGHGSPVGGVGGVAPVVPGKPAWRPWVRALQSTTLRYRFPFMSLGAIQGELAGLQAVA